MKYILLILAVIPPLVLSDDLPQVDKVLVNKSIHKMYLVKGEETLREYDISLGGNPFGHKEKEGDQRTPEGRYILDYKKSDSAFYKAIHISYPNTQDKMAAQEKGVDPGGAIMIHGQRNGYGWVSLLTQLFDWTHGCIAVTNSEIDEIWLAVNEGTPIEIYP